MEKELSRRALLGALAAGPAVLPARDDADVHGGAG